MSLSADVIARLSAQRLANLTNPDSQSSTTYDATRLGLAVTDAEADFEIYAGVVYDSANALHVPVGVRGVIAYLHVYNDNGAGASALKKFHEDLDALARVTSRDRILPTTNSPLQPTPEDLNGPAHPSFDIPVFGKVTLNPPSGTTTPDWDHGEDDD